MAAKAFAGGAWDIPEVRITPAVGGIADASILVSTTLETFPQHMQSVTFAGLTSRAVAPDDDVVFMVEPVNRAGNPVILTVSRCIAGIDWTNRPLLN